MSLTLKHDRIWSEVFLLANTAALCIELAFVCLLIGGCLEDRRADKAYLHGAPRKAAQELRYLAEQGEPRAQYDLGLLYDTGEGVPQDSREAMKWYQLAAAQGEERAQYNLGLMYANGQGGPQDYVQGYYWISVAAAQGNAHAAEAREYYAAKMTPDQMARAKALLELNPLRAKPESCQFCGK